LFPKSFSLNPPNLLPTSKSPLVKVRSPSVNVGLGSLANFIILPDVEFKASMEYKAGKFFKAYGFVAREGSQKDKEAAAAAAAVSAKAAAAAIRLLRGAAGCCCKLEHTLLQP
jgi:hypothetical protein